MTNELRERLRSLKFQDAAFGMRARLTNGISVTAVMHPLNGLVLVGHWFGRRKALEFERQLSADPSLQEIAVALLSICEEVERFDA